MTFKIYSSLTKKVRKGYYDLMPTNMGVNSKVVKEYFDAQEPVHSKSYIMRNEDHIPVRGNKM